LIVGRRLWFGYSLFDPPTIKHWVYRYTSGAAKAVRAHMDIHVIDLARDHGTFYAVVRPNTENLYEPCSADVPCTLQRLGAAVP
jgi:hypothetical protein